MSADASVSVRPWSRVMRSGAIIFTEFDDATVMMDVEKGRYYELDLVGARIWRLIASGPQMAEVCETLVAEFAVAPETCGDAVQAFVEELLRLEVIRISPGYDAMEMGADDAHGSAATPPVSGNVRPRSPGAKEGRREACWAAPTIRHVSVAKTAQKTTNVNYFEATSYGPPPS
ncbi:MAG: PqqD family protein [Acidobacteria bacterium]|nr:PqqD family protein [Acidobacteriota bacterium]